MLNKLLALIAAAGLLISVSGCNTFAGAGQDIQRGGEKIEETARDVQKRY